MCGITGFLIMNKKSQHVEDYYRTIKTMTHSIQRRGPDSFGYWNNSEKNLFLGHRRLSVIDFSEKGNQPMLSEKRNWVVVYNGEIYNFKELKKDLDIKNDFNNYGDTWVLVNLLEKFGFEKTISMLEGMFAIAAYNLLDSNLYISRDRFGEKPIYYYHNKNYFVFGSELKVFKNFPGINLEISDTSIKDYFTLNFIPSPQTIYKNIFKLTPGTIIKLNINSGSIEKKNYWKIKSEKKNKIQYCDVLKEADRILNETINKELTSDAKIGCFLSGGIDSTLVASIAASKIENLKTFTLKSSNYHFDESLFSRKVANFLKTEHYEFEIKKKDITESFFKMKEIYDEPFGDSSQIPTYLLSRYVKNYATVVLSGDGGDEMFLGYKRYEYFYKYWKFVNFFHLNLRKFFSKSINLMSSHFYDKMSFFLNKVTFGQLKYYNIGYSIQKFSELIIKENINDSFYFLIENPVNLTNLFINKKIYINEHEHVSTLEEIIIHDLNNYLPDDILCKVDRASMHNSLEVRSPLINHNIYNFVSHIPINQLINNGEMKSVLKDILKKYLPKHLINTTKRGFSVPISDWLGNDFKDILNYYTSKNYLSYQNIFDYNYIQKIIKEHESGNKRYEKFLWSFLIFQDWYSEHKLSI
jgi:asparagine synthase (glutamine-hydrolysing)